MARLQFVRCFVGSRVETSGATPGLTSLMRANSALNACVCVRESVCECVLSVYVGPGELLLVLRPWPEQYFDSKQIK